MRTRDARVSTEQLAREACEIEIDILGQPIGRQDQYAAAYGGINSIRFGPEGVSVERIDVSEEIIERLSNDFTLVFTGMSRSASEFLARLLKMSRTNLLAYGPFVDRLTKPFKW